MTMHPRCKWIFLLFAIMILSLTGCSFNQTKTVYVNDGIIDLSSLNFDQDTVRLYGKWGFYWNRFLHYNDLQREKPDLYADVPGTWNRYAFNGKNLPAFGYATYKLHVRTGLPEGTVIGLRSYTFSSAYRMYINDSLIAQNGKAATNASDEIGEYKPQAVYFSVPAAEFDIIVHVSNFHYARAGFWYAMFIGSASGIRDLDNGFMEKEAFLLGALVIVAMLFLTVYLLRKELRYSLYFACLCITVGIALDMAGQLILPRFFPGTDFRFVVFIWYSSYVWVVFFLISYMHELFKSGFSAIVARIYLIVSVTFQMLFILTPPSLFTGFAQVIDLVEISGILCAIIIAVIGIRQGQKGGILNIAGMAIVFLSYIHDDLYWMNLISGRFGELTYGGLFLFIFLQMIIQAKRIREYFDQKTAAELSFLQAQIKPHFLYNTINTVVSISRYDADQARELLKNFSNYLRRSFDFKDLSQSVPLKNEIELAKAYADIEKARFEERLEVNFDICDDLEAKVPILMLQPVIENAVNHGILPKPEGGRIDVSVKRNGKFLVFCVNDNGMGMETEKQSLLKGREAGKGVGLSNINGRLKKLYGEGLSISSSPGRGTEVSWQIPAYRKEE